MVTSVFDEFELKYKHAGYACWLNMVVISVVKQQTLDVFNRMVDMVTIDGSHMFARSPHMLARSSHGFSRSASTESCITTGADPELDLFESICDGSKFEGCVQPPIQDQLTPASETSVDALPKSLWGDSPMLVTMRSSESIPSDASEFDASPQKKQASGVAGGTSTTEDTGKHSSVPMFSDNRGGYGFSLAKFPAPLVGKNNDEQKRVDELEKAPGVSAAKSGQRKHLKAELISAGVKVTKKGGAAKSRAKGKPRRTAKPAREAASKSTRKTTKTKDKANDKANDKTTPASKATKGARARAGERTHPDTFDPDTGIFGCSRCRGNSNGCSSAAGCRNQAGWEQHEDWRERADGVRFYRIDPAKAPNAD